MSEKSRKILYDKINSIIADWDPIGVGSPISMDEYKRYILRILALKDSKEDIRNFLVELVTEKLGLDHDLTNDDHNSEIQGVVEKIFALHQ